MTGRTRGRALATLLGSLLAASPVGAVDHPSVVFVMLDTTRADRFGSWGGEHATTPVLDQLASEGAQFVRHFANSHATRPSLPQIVSGRYFHPSILRPFEPDAHPRDYPFLEADPASRLLTNLLRDAGFRLHQQGRLTDGNFLEFLQSHTNVVFQPEFDDRRYSGFNPYALGFAMMQEIERIVKTPEDEDRDWFPDIAGKGNVEGVLREIWSNYRDESFINQFLSPALIRRFRMCSTSTTTLPKARGSRSMRSMTSAVTAGCAASWRGNTMSASSSPISRSWMSISTAIAA